MAFKDILVYADATPYAAARLDVAAKVAIAHGAHLMALHVDHTPYMPVDIMGTGVAAQVRQWQKTLQKERADKVRHLVDEASQRNGIAIEWRQAEGEVNDLIQTHAAYTDLIVVSQEGNPFDLEQPIDPSPGALALSSGRPVMVVPGRVGSYDVGSNILVAWKSSAESVRAVHDALPFLQKAKTVTVLEANPQDSGKRLVGAEIAQHLARHGVRVSAMSVKEASVSDGQLILARAAEIGADMIVMGAYGHSRLREVVLGGVTKHVLKQQNIPIFMAH
jgi:nucleotide-binding universal stress UspA family protein